MQIVYKNIRNTKPLVSIILIDWSCRESFHTLDYLNEQTVPRDDYEILWIEYYSRRPDEIASKIARAEKAGKPPVVNQWIAMEVPSNIHYHKHVMYNVGIFFSSGRIVIICDSDCIMRPTFIRSILDEFDKDENTVLHLDEIRNNDKRFYPFNYPSIEEVLGEGCIDLKVGKSPEDLHHTRNYGACMAAWRGDLIDIGGADQHLDYLGRACGPYEMTFRLRSIGRKEKWHEVEYLYHVWHPGITEGEFVDYMGPYDGTGMSTTALDILKTGRVHPLMENPAINHLKQSPDSRDSALERDLLLPLSSLTPWDRSIVGKKILPFKPPADYVPRQLEAYKRYNLLRYVEHVYAVPQHLGPRDFLHDQMQKHPDIFSCDTVAEAKSWIDQRPRLDHMPQQLGAYKGFNLVHYLDQIYAVPYALGPFDLSDEQARSHPNILVSKTKAEAKQLIDQCQARLDDSRGPLLVEEGYRGFNLVFFRNRYHAVAQKVGPFDLTTATATTFAKLERLSRYAYADSVEDLKLWIDRHSKVAVKASA